MLSLCVKHERENDSRFPLAAAPHLQVRGCKCYCICVSVVSVSVVMQARLPCSVHWFQTSRRSQRTDKHTGNGVTMTAEGNVIRFLNLYETCQV